VVASGHGHTERYGGPNRRRTHYSRWG
jgi:hypothetical protein